MKSFIPYSLLAAAAACGLAFGQAGPAYTTPVGYTTVAISPGIFNLVGVTVHESVVVAGIIDSATSNTVVDADVDFSTLPAGNYILELTDGSGIVQEVTVLSSTELSTPEDISASITDNVTTYNLRPVSTLDSIFGSDNSKANLVASTDGSANGVDKVLVQTSTGLQTFYYVDIPGTFEGWFDGAAPAGDTVLNYADGLYVQTIPGSAATDFTISGEVKVFETGSILNPGFNLLNAVAPAGLTLGSSGLQAYVEPSVDGSTSGADLVVIPDALNPGSFKNYYYVDIPGTLQAWFDGAQVADDVELTGAFFLNNLEGSIKPYVVNPPTIGN
jgi:hypothetical protein